MSFKIYGFDFAIADGQIAPNFECIGLRAFLDLINPSQESDLIVQSKLKTIAGFLQFKQGKFFVQDSDRGKILAKLNTKEKILVLNLDATIRKPKKGDRINYPVNQEIRAGVLETLEALSCNYWLIGMAKGDPGKSNPDFIEEQRITLKLCQDYLTAIVFPLEKKECGALRCNSSHLSTYTYKNNLIETIAQEIILDYYDPNCKLHPENYCKLQYPKDSCIIVGNEGDRLKAKQLNIEFKWYWQLNHLTEF